EAGEAIAGGVDAGDEVDELVVGGAARALELEHERGEADDALQLAAQVVAQAVGEAPEVGGEADGARARGEEARALGGGGLELEPEGAGAERAADHQVNALSYMIDIVVEHERAEEVLAA